MICDVERHLDAVNLPNANIVSGLPQDSIIEIPATVSKEGLKPVKMEGLPEPILTLLRTQTSINKLLVEAYQGNSKQKLLQTVLLEPTVNSYHNAVACINEMLALQQDVLPELK